MFHSPASLGHVKTKLFFVSISKTLVCLKETYTEKGGGGGGKKGCKQHHVSVTNVTEILRDRHGLSLLIGISLRVCEFSFEWATLIHMICAIILSDQYRLSVPVSSLIL